MGKVYWHEYGFKDATDFIVSRKATEMNVDDLENIFKDPKILFRYIKYYLIHGKQSKRKVKDNLSGLMCSYRGDNDSMCAVGCVLPDDLYTQDLEGWGLDKLILKIDAPKFITNNYNMLLALQKVHDSSDAWCNVDGHFIGSFALDALEKALFGKYID